MRINRSLRLALGRLALRRLRSDRRGLAAIEFALIAPALILMVVGVLELSLRFRANEEASRYVHEVADLIARESTLTTASLKDIYNASVNMMKPLDTTNKLDFDAAAVGYTNNAGKTPYVMWRRAGGHVVPFTVGDAAGMGAVGESVIHVGVKYSYTSPITTLFGGPNLAVTKFAYTRPRMVRLVSMDGKTDDGGAVKMIN